MAGWRARPGPARDPEAWPLKKVGVGEAAAAVALAADPADVLIVFRASVSPA